MTVSIAEQAAAFTGAVVMGFGVGLLYDLLRLLRQRLRLALLGSILDLLFWAVVTVTLFLFTIAATEGEVRIYVLLALLGGAVAYFLGLSAWVLSLGDALVDVVRALVGLLLLPLRLLGRALKKIQKNLKNLFLYRRKWFKIEAEFKRMEEVSQFGAARREVGECHAHSKSRSANKNRDPGPPDRSGHFTAGAQQSGGAGPDGESESGTPGGRADSNQHRSGRIHRAQRRSRPN